VASEQREDRGGDRPNSSGPPPSPAPPAWTVERITHQDVPSICALYKKVWDADASGLPNDLVKTWQPTPLEFTSWMEGVTYFAARHNGRVIGAIGCEIRHAACHLVHLGVDPEVRRQGVASALVAASIDWAKHANSPVVWADALARFTAAAALFKRLGFTECGVLHKHEWNEDVRLFELLI
jgi:RimJ/RimL family protein N-acetyltransferase